MVGAFMNHVHVTHRSHFCFHLTPFGVYRIVSFSVCRFLGFWNCHKCKLGQKMGFSVKSQSRGVLSNKLCVYKSIGYILMLLENCRGVEHTWDVSSTTWLSGFYIQVRIPFSALKDKGLCLYCLRNRDA